MIERQEVSLPLHFLEDFSGDALLKKSSDFKGNKTSNCAVNFSQVFSLGFVMVGRASLLVGIEKGQLIFLGRPDRWLFSFYCVRLDKFPFT